MAYHRPMQDADYYVTENLLALRNTRVGNLMGGCALTLPTGVPSCGMQLIAAPGSERRLLRLGLAVEAVLCGAETVRGGDWELTRSDPHRPGLAGA